MKNSLLFCFLIIGTTAFAQSNFKINLISNLDYSFSNYTYNEGRTLEEDVDFKMPLGYSFEMTMEYHLSNKITFASGFRLGKHNLSPKLALPWSYGTVFQFEEESVFMITPYMAKHEIKTFSIPLIFKYHFKSENKLSYFALVGVEVGFQYDETEIYKDQYQGNVELGDEPLSVSYKDDTIQLFGSSIELGFGLNYKLTKSLNLILQTNANVLEYRKGNEKFKKNGDMIWENNFLPIGQASLGLGIQQAF